MSFKFSASLGIIVLDLILTSNEPILSNSSVVLRSVLAVHQLAQPASQEPRDGVLQPVVGDVEQLQRGPSDHPLGHVVGDQAF